MTAGSGDAAGGPAVGGRHFSFRSVALTESVAHGGRGTVLASRVLERAGECGLAFLDLVTVPVGSTIGVHTHGAADEEIYVVIGGSGRMSLEREEFAVGPGDVITNPPGGTHGLVNTGAGPLTLVVLDLTVSDQPGQTGRRGRGVDR